MTQRHLNHQGLLQVSRFFQSNVAPIACITNPEESEIVVTQRHLNHQGLLQVSGFFQINVAPIAGITNPEESESSDSETSKPSGASEGKLGGLCDALLSQSTIFQSC